MKKNMPTTTMLIFFSWITAALGMIFATGGALFNGITISSFATAVLTMAGGLIVAIVLRMLAKIGQLTFDLNRSVSGNLSLLHKNMDFLYKDIENITKNIYQINQNTQHIYQNIRRIDQNTQQIDRNIQQIDQNTRQIDQNTKQIDQNAQQINQSTHQTNEFLLTMKRHIESQQ